jgi:hypothetical protein
MTSVNLSMNPGTFFFKFSKIMDATKHGNLSANILTNINMPCYEQEKCL